MCGRYTLRRPERLAALRAGTQWFEEFSEVRLVQRFNIAPSQLVPTIRMNATGRPALTLVRWGLIPSWTKGKPKQQPINARAETVARSGMFRQAFERRRCLVPADGFYEWQLSDGRKQPMFMHAIDDAPFAFAGVWERWQPDAEAEPIDTMTIITTTPNELLRPIHDRMPVILAQADYDRWLDRQTRGEAVADLLVPYNGDAFVTDRISTRVNSPKNDDEACIAPLAE